jgi:hypothetical protein
VQQLRELPGSLNLYLGGSKARTIKQYRALSLHELPSVSSLWS